MPGATIERHLEFVAENLGVLRRRSVRGPSWYREYGYWWGQRLLDLGLLADGH